MQHSNSNSKLFFYIKEYSSTLVVLLSVLAGIGVGLSMGQSASIFLPLGNIFLNLMFTIVMPLLFFVVSSSIANIVTMKSVERTFLTSLGVFIGMIFIASISMLVIVKIFPFTDSGPIPLIMNRSLKDVSIASGIVSMFTSTDFATMLAKNAIMPLIIFAIIFGASVKSIGSKGDSTRQFLNTGSLLLFKMIDYLMVYAPVGLFAYFAYFFGTASTDLLGLLAGSVYGFYIVSIIFMVIFYGYLAYYSAGIDGLKALKYTITPIATAFATKSSLATLPISLNAANEMNFPKSVSNITLPLGSLIHLDGNVLSVILEIAFLFGVFGIPMAGASFYLELLLLILFIPIISVGIPGGNFILQSVIIMVFGLPTSVLPVLVTLTYLIDPIMTVVNVMGNIVATMVISKIVKGNGWILRKDIEEDITLGIYK